MNNKNDRFFDSLGMEAQCGIINAAKTLMKEARRRDDGEHIIRRTMVPVEELEVVK